MSETSVSTCLEKIRVATDYHNKWWKKFRVSDSIKYYEGAQWAGYSTYFRNEYRPSVVNLVFSTIEVQLPSLLFSQPIFNVTPKKTATDPEGESQRTFLQEAALNTFVTDPDSLFAEEIEAAIIDSYFAFGVIEAGLDSNYVINPNADKPYLKKDGTVLRDIDGTDIIQPKEIPEYEQLYLKRIHPSQIRVGGMDSRYLDRCNWVAYYEYVDVLDLKGNKALKGTDKLTFSGARTEEFDKTSYEDRSGELDKLCQSGDVVKVWHYWDQRRHEFHLFTDVLTDDYLFSAPYRGLPLFELKYHNRMRGFYPVPPVSQWLPQQDDINIAQEQIRVHQRRGSRKYLVRKNALDTDQLDTLMFGPDGTYAETEMDPNTVIAPVPLSPLDASVDKVLLLAKDNFNIVSGTRAEARGVADRTTATQASIMDQRSMIRESRPKIIVANWLNRIARQIMILQQKITLPFWIEVNNTPQESLGGDVQETSKLYQEITGLDIEGQDFSVNINVTSMSPIDMQDQKNKFLEFMAVINNYPQIAMSPTLIRETATRIGFKTNEKVLKELQDMALLQQAGQQAQIQGALGQTGKSPLGQREVAKATPSDQEQITNQLQNQVGLTQ